MHGVKLLFVLGLCVAVCGESVSELIAADSGDSKTTQALTSINAHELSESQREALLLRGSHLFANQCASCHGEKGQGIDGAYESALAGDRSVQELATVIDQTMPEGEPELCVSEDAFATALYAYENFYSEAAQLRISPPRAALARLTAEQFRQSVTDIYTHFRRRNQVGEERGLNAIYFNHSGWKEDKRAFERVDAKIDYDYGMESPGEGIENKKFSIYWNGGILVPESGRYEIIVRGMGAFKVYLIDTEKAFFDNHVQSGDAAEYKANIELLGGRLYPLRLEFFKRERKTGDVPASFSLSWRRPGGVEEIIPTRNLVPGGFEKTFAPQVQLPADDRSAGYERGSTISREWDEATTKGAVEFANVVADDLWPRYAKDRRKKNDAPEGRELLRQFAYELVDVSLRRPAGDDVRKAYVDDQLAATDDDNEALRRIVILTLKSPRFLYPSLASGVSPDFQNSMRLAMTMWDSVPDDRLWRDAEKGSLNSETQLRDAAWRMLEDPRTKAKAREALHHWLNLGHIGELTKSEELFAGFDAKLVSDLRDSLDLFLESVVWSEASDFRQLLQSDWAYTSDRMAKFYGDQWKPTGDDANGDFSRTASNAELRVGVLTHPLMMSGLAYNDTTSPIHRGVFLTRFMLGRVMRPPTDAFAPLSPSLHADLTTRERVHLQTGLTACQSCHSVINALGFSLEQFDAVGKWRTEEKSKPIDATGSYIDRQGINVAFNGARELSQYLINSDDAQTAFINRMFLHFVKQPIGAYGVDRLEQMKVKFRESDYNIRRLIVEIAVVAAMGPEPQETI